MQLPNRENRLVPIRPLDLVEVDDEKDQTENKMVFKPLPGKTLSASGSVLIARSRRVAMWSAKPTFTPSDTPINCALRCENAI